MNSGGMGIPNSGPIPNTHRLDRIAIPHHGAGDMCKGPLTGTPTMHTSSTMRMRRGSIV